jgi:hypothetical protein
VVVGVFGVLELELEPDPNPKNDITARRNYFQASPIAAFLPGHVEF